MGILRRDNPLMMLSHNGFILGPKLFLLYINDLPDEIISNIPIYTHDTTLYFKCDHSSDMRRQLGLACELESYLWAILD